jgi:long-subunit acyl-CoA synthetase (AMP-forming)
LRAIVLMEGASDLEGVYSWEELLALGDGVPTEELQERIDRLAPDDCCSLIYTSGTTGTPKAVMISHHNTIWTAQAVIDHFDFRPTDDFISYLPLSHIAEQMLSLYAPIVVGGCVWFAESIEALPDNLREVRPHIFFGVPRVWEKIQAGIQAAAAGNSPLKRRLGAWARRQGLVGGYAQQRGGSPPLLYGLAKRLVFDKVRAKLGLDRARVCAVAAAPSALETLEFFLSLGIPILEVYGQSECTGPTTISTPDRFRTGSTGWVIPGTEIKIVEDGEIWMRGPHVFLGYYKDPEATDRALDPEGWLHSGDVGHLDEDGFLYVTDRKKELIVTSGGKNIAPQPIEGQLRTIQGVAHAVVIGDRRKFLTALITLEPETITTALNRAGSPERDEEGARRCEIFRAYLDRAIDSVNQSLARYETIKRFAILPEGLTIDGGELTPTMKVKRRIVHSKYGDVIENLYADA